MSNNVHLNFNNQGRTFDEAYEMLEPVLKSWDVKLQDVESVASASMASVVITRVAGIRTIATVELSRPFSNGCSQPAIYGTNVVVRILMYTPNNRSCSSIGNIVFSESYDNAEDAMASYQYRVALAGKE